ncbi:MAG: hypothetical protein P4L36_22575 [Holophaga sp.]|nr:hypothetical protein [Holophaga sp.]
MSAWPLWGISRPRSTSRSPNGSARGPRWIIAPGDRYQGQPDLPGYHEMVYVIRGEGNLSFILNVVA